MKRTPLKRGRRKPRPSLQGFWEAVTADGASGCALAYLGGCAGPLDAHHAYPANRIRRNVAPELRDQAVTDPRCGIPCCRKHHAQVENRRIVCPRPPDLDAFLAEYGLVERSAA